MYPKKDLIDAWINATLALETESFQEKKTLIHSFEVKPPILVGNRICSTVLAKHEFPFSYGKPFIGKYRPQCEGYNQVVLTFESTVSGRQFDRVGALWMDGVELWRYTTQEPSGNAFNTYWKAEKDVSKYLGLFREEHDIVLALDNVVDDTYTGIFNVTVTLDYYVNSNESEAADVILPLSASKNSYGWYTLPINNHPLYHEVGTIPNNTIKALVEVFVSAHSQDEFWYGNVPGQSSDNGVYGSGPFKEVQLWINDRLVGLDWPFPTIYTGGFNPLLWRPIVAINAFDVPSMIFDITPFLSLLFSGRNSTRIGFNITNEALPFWFIDGNLLLYVDKDKDPLEPFKGSLDSMNVRSQIPHYTIVGDLNQTLDVLTVLQNSFSASGTVYHSDGYTRTSVHKSVDYLNINTLWNQGSTQNIDQKTSIHSSTLTERFGDRFSSLLHVSQYQYPLQVNLSYFKNESGYEYDVVMDHGLHINRFVKKNQEKLTSLERLDTNQYASGYFGTIRPGVAGLKQNYFHQTPEQCYRRSIRAYNRTVISDNTGC
jgi:uroporphyrinogen decarboxylase